MVGLLVFFGIELLYFGAGVVWGADQHNKRDSGQKKRSDAQRKLKAERDKLAAEQRKAAQLQNALRKRLEKVVQERDLHMAWHGKTTEQAREYAREIRRIRAELPEAVFKWRKWFRRRRSSESSRNTTMGRDEKHIPLMTGNDTSRSDHVDSHSKLQVRPDPSESGSLVSSTRSADVPAPLLRRGRFFQSGTVRRVAIIPSDLMQACKPGTVASDGLDTFHVPQQQTGDAHGK